MLIQDVPRDWPFATERRAMQSTFHAVCEPGQPARGQAAQDPPGDRVVQHPLPDPVRTVGTIDPVTVYHHERMRPHMCVQDRTHTGEDRLPGFRMQIPIAPDPEELQTRGPRCSQQVIDRVLQWGPAFSASQKQMKEISAANDGHTMPEGEFDQPLQRVPFIDTFTVAQVQIGHDPDTGYGIHPNDRAVRGVLRIANPERMDRIRHMQCKNSIPFSASVALHPAEQPHDGWPYTLRPARYDAPVP